MVKAEVPAPHNNLGKGDPNSGGASEQVEHVAAKQVMEEQPPVEDPLLKDLIDLVTEAIWLSSDLNFGGAGEQVLQDQATVEDPLLKDLIDPGTEATWSSSNLNSGGAGEQVLKDQAVVDAPLRNTGPPRMPPRQMT